MSHESTVPNIMFPLSCASLTSGEFSSNHRTLTALKYVVRGNPQMSYMNWNCPVLYMEAREEEGGRGLTALLGTNTSSHEYQISMICIIGVCAGVLCWTDLEGVSFLLWRITELSDNILRSGVWPDNGIMQWLACRPVPSNGRLSLVGNANSYTTSTSQKLRLEKRFFFSFLLSFHVK